MSATRRNQAAWEKSATDLADDIARAAELRLLSIEQVSAGTGLAISTIDDCLYRQPNLAPGSLRALLCRPEYRMGSTPYWTPEQLGDAWGDEAAERAREVDAVEKGDPDEPLAVWKRSATNLAADLSRLTDVLPITAMADATGLSVKTIWDSLFRHEVTDPSNPRAYLCRPAFRIDSIPLWSREQRDAAVAAMPAQRGRTGRGPKLPMVDPGADVVSIREIVAATSKHEQTVRKWLNGSYPIADGTLPPAPIGRRPQAEGRRRGNPETVYDRAAMHAFLDPVADVEALSSPNALRKLRDLLAVGDDPKVARQRAAEERPEPVAG